MKWCLLMTSLLLLTGCTYLSDRGRDACDMVTLAAETNTYNAGIHLGSSGIGLGVADGKGFGLRSGNVGSYEFKEANIIIAGAKSFTPGPVAISRKKGYLTEQIYDPVFEDDDDDEVEYEVVHENHNSKRFKKYVTDRKFKKSKIDKSEKDYIKKGKWHNSFLLEANAGLGVGARVGVNFAEIADFFLGWVNVDICDDDISKLLKYREERLKEEQAQNSSSPAKK